MKKQISFFFLNYLRILAKIQLSKTKLLCTIKYKSPLTIIGITGSAGKTSTLSATYAVLKNHYKTVTNFDANSESGIPLNILGLKIDNYSCTNWLKIAFLAPIKLLTNWKTYQVYIVEMGIDASYSPKNMEYLLTIIKPQIAVFLNVTPVHLTNFSSLNQIAQEKAKILKNAKYAILNLKDPLVKKHSQTNTNIIPIKPIKIKTKKYPLPQIYQISFGAAIAIAKILGIKKSIAIKNIQKHFKLPPGRASTFKGIKNSTIIDSSYNSSPLACQESLKFLSRFHSPKIAILGDMRELGKQTKKSHQNLYKFAQKHSDKIISIGPETTKHFGPKAKKFTYWWQATGFLHHHPKFISKSHILVKGSQNTIFLEELVKSLLKNKSDSSKLCRQSPYWLKLKTQFKQQNT
ncbi:hypothetical protein KKC08_03015 [Patescibacteria group bacterium]|nr:hypothetical protein [Patescibacteria group bacterium]MCG2701975.1 hypothetical protein [Candidatus Parcubacteria bacterium]MBU4265023.1 hypothetical protein [Patescibacteria group bacterium]MBU4390176.1 hypothetical protein [Patescibacteria group bacterium]MBU4397109.1 hypothetical protein [Patescibacteria group bacterium]